MINSSPMQEQAQNYNLSFGPRVEGCPQRPFSSPPSNEIKEDNSTAAKTQQLYLSSHVKLVLFVPETHANKIREVMGRFGAGTIKNYTYCTFSTPGIARSKEQSSSMVSVPEEKIETIVKAECLHELIKKLEQVHPYKVMGYDVFPMLNLRAAL